MHKPTPEQIYAWVTKNFDYKSRKGGDELLIANPWYENDSKKLEISCSKAVLHDWRGDTWAGGKGCTFLRFVQLYRNCSYVEAAREVCGQDTSLSSIYRKLRRQEQEEKEEEAQTSVALPTGSKLLFENQQDGCAKGLLGWLQTRGVTLEMVERHKLSYHSMYVVWPYFEYGSLVYWQERDRLNKSFRFPPESVGVSKGMFLYGFDMVEPGDYVIVTEAIFGSMTLGDQAVATGGASIVERQVKKLRALNPANGVILAPDNDDPGLVSLVANYKLLSPYFKVYYAVPPKLEYDGGVTKDFNELYEHVHMDRKEIRTMFENSVRPLDLGVICKIIINSKSKI